MWSSNIHKKQHNPQEVLMGSIKEVDESCVIFCSTCGIIPPCRIDKNFRKSFFNTGQVYGFEIMEILESIRF